MIIRKHFVPFVLMQRTQYLDKSFLYRAVNKALKTFGYSKYPGIIQANQLLNSGQIKDLYQADMEAEFDSIIDHLPTCLNNVLDIGCGIGGIDALIAAHYKYNINVFLIDKSVVDKDLHYGYDAKGSCYNSLTYSKKFLTDNGVPNDRIFLQEANEKNTIVFDARFDLIISLISWGFHYPVQTYLDFVYKQLATDGLLIIDVRKGTSGIDELKAIFERTSIIKDYPKYVRIKAQKLKSA